MIRLRVLCITLLQSLEILASICQQALSIFMLLLVFSGNFSLISVRSVVNIFGCGYAALCALWWNSF
jgi:hypothetical protein